MTTSNKNNHTEAQNLYLRLGGEEVVRQFANYLYDFMANSEQVAHVRNMHSKNLSHASDRLFMFLSGMLGGPPLYMEAFGPPRLRRRHLHLSIGNEERDQWLMCAQYAANKLHIEPDVRADLMAELTVMANHLRNNDAATQQCTDNSI